MDYKTKVKHAKAAANQLQQQKSIDTIKGDLKAEGLLEKDITSILVSARKILGETYQPKIQAYLLEDKQIHGAEEFSLLDAEVIDILITKATQNLEVKEKRKIVKSMKEGVLPMEVFEQVDKRFLSADNAAEHIERLEGIKTQNSGSGRMLNILGGVGLIALTGILAVTIDRLFYVLPVIGLIMIVKGFTTERME